MEGTLGPTSPVPSLRSTCPPARGGRTPPGWGHGHWSCLFTERSETVKLRELQRVPWVCVRGWPGHAASTQAVPSVGCHHWDLRASHLCPVFLSHLWRGQEQRWVGAGAGRGLQHEWASGWSELRVWEVSPRDPAPWATQPDGCVAGCPPHAHLDVKCLETTCCRWAGR